MITNYKLDHTDKQTILSSMDSITYKITLKLTNLSSRFGLAHKSQHPQADLLQPHILTIEVVVHWLTVQWHYVGHFSPEPTTLIV